MKSPRTTDATRSETSHGSTRRKTQGLAKGRMASGDGGGEPADGRRRAGARTAAGDLSRAGGAPEQAVKTFVLDTNVLLHDPDSLFAFEEHNVVIPFAVLEEIDTFKKGNDDIGRSARQCIRHLDRLRERGPLVEGVPWGGVARSSAEGAEEEPDGEGAGRTGVVRIDIDDVQRPEALKADKPDNHIIAVAWKLAHEGLRTVFVSKDINARIKADALGIQAEDYENKKIDARRLYKGYTSVEASGELIDELYKERMLAIGRLADGLAVRNGEGKTHARKVEANQFVIMHDAVDESHSGLARRVGDTDHVVPVTAPRKPVFGVMARNIEQTMALDLLLDDEIKLVTMTGGAGTGKTLLALAAGMHKVFQEQRYDRLLVARPIMPMGRDIGYLPGDKEEKLSAWMQPIFDNLDYLLSTRGSHMQTAESKSTEQRIEKLLADGKLVLEPLTYIRGRSIPHQFMIVDEAQNLSPHEVKTIVSRVGEGTKLVLTGDIEQIDHPYLDASSNGLSFVVERMREQPLVGHVALTKSERSELASIAAERL